MSQDCFDSALIAQKLLEGKKHRLDQSFGKDVPGGEVFRLSLLESKANSDLWWEEVNKLQQSGIDVSKTRSWFQQLAADIEQAQISASLARKLSTCGENDSELPKLNAAKSFYILEGYGKSLVLLGEIHEKFNSCRASNIEGKLDPNVLQVWSILIKLENHARALADRGVGDGKVDTFIEEPWKYNRKVYTRGDYESPLRIIQTLYQGCLQIVDERSSEKCKKRLGNQRIHPVDMRLFPTVNFPETQPHEFKEWFVPLISWLQEMNDRFWTFRESTQKQMWTREFQALPVFAKETLERLRSTNIRNFEAALRQSRTKIQQMKKSRDRQQYQQAVNMMRELHDLSINWVELYAIFRFFKPYVHVAVMIFGDAHIRQLIPILQALNFHFVYEAPKARLPFRKFSANQDSCILLHKDWTGLLENS